MTTATRRRVKLAPLEPDAFLRWAWKTGPRIPGSTPITVDDNWLELAWAYRPGPGEPADFREVLPIERLRHDYVTLAARVRRNQRLGFNPWHGITRLA